MTYRTDCVGLEELSDKDRENIGGAMTMSYMKKLFGTALREIEGKKSQIAAIDLGSDQGIKAGLKLQGEIAGMARFLDLMLEGTKLE